MTAGLPLTKYILKTSAESVLLPLGLTAAAPVTNAAIQAIQKKVFGLETATLLFLNEDRMKIVKSLEVSGLLIKGVSGAVENEVKEQEKAIFRHVSCCVNCQFIGKFFNW